ncbi:MAG: lysine--tRNA ligase [Candidatus Altiarchaeales archaeon ex4484_96]|nr:MAG: lysine--tRNA ligase [Candidatus Altiarchaeales archaeon ex4484_96]
MQWFNAVAEKLLERVGAQVIETGTSISGVPHIGNASDVIRGDAIRKALDEENAEVDFIWIADDSDPFRRVPGKIHSTTKYLDEVSQNPFRNTPDVNDLGDYLGYPVKDIPDPLGCHQGFVQHYVEPFLSNLDEFGVRPKAYSATELYKKNAFEKEIKEVFNKSDEVTRILNRFRKKPLPEDSIYWSPICESCGKIATTRPTELNGLRVSYVCEDTTLSGRKVKGCGFEGESDIRKGEGKLPWRIEWAVRWKHFKVTCEPLGKEHASAGGSYWTSKIISAEILGWEPPLPVIYEFFTLNGEKISSSKGNVITLRDWLRICEPEVLKYFMYKRLKKQRDIKLSSLPNLVDEYDKAERIFFGLEEGAEKEKQLYAMSQIKKPRLLQVPFTLCAVLSQVLGELDSDEAVNRIKRAGYSGFDVKRLMRRLHVAGEWAESCGPDNLRFNLVGDEQAEKNKKKLSPDERKVLLEIAHELDDNPSAETLHKRIYEISREHQIKPSEVFRDIYQVLIGKNRGPKAAFFLLSLDVDFVKKRFR